MKILHTADWHLGRRFHGRDLTEEFEAWCSWVIDTVRTQGVDAVLISGDVYDYGNPPQAMVDLLDDTLTALASECCVILTSGNHDSASRLGFGSRLIGKGVHIRTRGEDAGTPVAITGNDGELALIYPIPYLDPDTYRRRFAPHGGLDANGNTDSRLLLERTHEAVMHAALELVRHDIEHGEYAKNECARIVMAHAFVSGAEASESNRPFSVGGAESIPAGIFRLGAEVGPGPLNYVALGHLHSPQRIGANSSELPDIRYSGSPIAFSFGERAKKTATLLAVKNGSVSATTLECPVIHEVVSLEGTLDELTSGKYEHYRDAYVDITVTDDVRPPRIKERLHTAFTHPLKITITAEQKKLSARVRSIQGLAPSEIFEAFVHEVAGRKLSAGEREACTRTWEETMKRGEQ